MCMRCLIKILVGSLYVLRKRPVKLIQRMKIAQAFLHVLSELFDPITFSLSKLLNIWPLTNFSKPTAKLTNSKWLFFSFTLSAYHESWLEYSVEFLSSTWKQFVFHLVVFAATVSMLCIHIRHLKLYVSRQFSTYFPSGGKNERNFKIS